MPSLPELYEKLKPGLSEEEARSLLEYIESTVEQRAATEADVRQTAGRLREHGHAVQAGPIKRSGVFPAGAVAVLSGIVFPQLRPLGPR